MVPTSQVPVGGRHSPKAASRPGPRPTLERSTMTTRGLARMFTRRTSALLAASAVVLISAGPAVAGSYTPGSSGAGDPYFPQAGNGGYDVSHYSLSLGYEPASKQLTGTGGHHRDRDAEPLAIRPRPAGLHDLHGAGERLASGLRARRRPGARDHTQQRPSRRSTRSRSRSRTPACPRSSPTPTGRSRAGSRPTTAPSSSASHRARPAGTRSTTTRGTRRPSTSRVTVPEGLTVMANGVLVSHRSSGSGARPGSGERATRWLRTSPRRRSVAST